MKDTGERLFYTSQLGFQTAELINQRGWLIYTSVDVNKVLEKAANLDALVFKEGCSKPL